MAKKTSITKKNPVGAPRTVSPSKEDVISLGEEMIQWVTKNQPIHLSKWYSLEKHYTDKYWDTLTKLEQFLPYYDQALKIVGYKYLEKDSPIEPSLKQRWQRVYFKDIKAMEDEKAIFESNLRKQEQNMNGQNITVNITDYAKKND